MFPHSSAERFRKVRKVAYGAVAERAITSGWGSRGIVIADINFEALKAYKSSWAASHPHGELVWDWDAHAGQISTSAVNRFGFSIFHDSVLCWLARGHLSKSGTVIALDYVEGNPNPRHPLRGNVIQISVAVVDAIGALSKARIVRLMNPTPALVGYYCQDRFGGFKVVPAVGRAKFCEREVLP